MSKDTKKLDIKKKKTYFSVEFLLLFSVFFFLGDLLKKAFEIICLAHYSGEFDFFIAFLLRTLSKASSVC